ncbi:hypothetical protein [Bacillus cereus]|uniref:hypothetical protein n=1 Tax=Bacillus cereus TaxID=1396 RepID=UPI000BEE4181|nr:hypothetical protein [Bacillus cereus]PEC81956.1 hypothetical protein CON28_29035 [Bacillus cereus]
MEKVSLILSIIASIGTIISIIVSFRLKTDLDSLKQEISGDKNIQSSGDNVINNTGDHSTFKR